MAVIRLKLLIFASSLKLLYKIGSLRVAYNLVIMAFVGFKADSVVCEVSCLICREAYEALIRAKGISFCIKTPANRLVIRTSRGLDY